MATNIRKNVTKFYTRENKENGITLVALVITVIVLLILATVSISLVINNGILDKAKYAVDKYSEGEICEQIKLAYLECETEKLYNSNVNDAEFLTNSLREKLNDNDLTVEVKKGKVIVDTTVSGKTKTYIFKSSTGETYEYIDPFNYGEYTKENIPIGYDISIGSENFRVFYNQNGIIKAMPWYNIELKIDNPKQSSTAGGGTFSTRAYWATNEDGTEINNWRDKADSIDMNNNSNNIQKYIEAYDKTLENLGAESITVRAVQYSELNKSEVIPTIKNPKQSNNFWTKSCDFNNSDIVFFVSWNGYLTDTGTYSSTKFNGYNIGVRPIIVIEY